MSAGIQFSINNLLRSPGLQREGGPPPGCRGESTEGSEGGWPCRGTWPGRATDQEPLRPGPDQKTQPGTPLLSRAEAGRGKSLNKWHPGEMPPEHQERDGPSHAPIMGCIVSPKLSPKPRTSVRPHLDMGLHGRVLPQHGWCPSRDRHAVTRRGRPGRTRGASQGRGLQGTSSCWRLALGPQPPELRDVDPLLSEPPALRP